LKERNIAEGKAAVLLHSEALKVRVWRILVDDDGDACSFAQRVFAHPSSLARPLPSTQFFFLLPPDLSLVAMERWLTDRASIRSFPAWKAYVRDEDRKKILNFFNCFLTMKDLEIEIASFFFVLLIFHLC
jgi:hypothetical protein